MAPEESEGQPLRRRIGDFLSGGRRIGKAPENVGGVSTDAIMDAVAEGVLAVDPAGVIVHCNPAARHLLGAHEHQALGQDHGVYFHPDRETAAGCCALMDAAAGKERRGGRTDVTRGDGSKVDVLSWATPLRSGAGAVALLREPDGDAVAAELQTLTLNLTQSMGRASTRDEALDAALKSLCQTLGWSFGEAWLPVDGRLQLGAAWAPSVLARRRWFSARRGERLNVGEGLAGRAWASRRTVYFPDVTQDPGLEGGGAAPQGCTVAAALPVLEGSDLLATFVLFAALPSQALQRNAQAAGHATAQVGWVLRLHEAATARTPPESGRTGKTRRDGGDKVADGASAGAPDGPAPPAADAAAHKVSESSVAQRADDEGRRRRPRQGSEP